MPRTTFAKRKHLCPACQKAFTTSGHLLRHSKVHTGEKKHKCPFPGCQTSCSRQDNLQQHYRIHLSSGSRRSSSGSLAKPFIAPTEIDDGISTTLPSDVCTNSPVHEIEPYTIVNSPPVLQIPGNDRRYHHHMADPRFPPSPPNTPPPLVPANPCLLFQPHFTQQGRRSTGTDPESAELPRRPPSSSSCSSSGTSSPVPPFELFGRMDLLNRSESSLSSSSPYSVGNDASVPIWVEDHSQQQISSIGDEVFTSSSFMVHDDFHLSKQPPYQPTYATNPIVATDYFGYDTLPGDTGPAVVYSASGTSFQHQQQPQQPTMQHPFDSHPPASNFSALPAPSIAAHSSADHSSADYMGDEHQHHHSQQHQHFSIDHNQQLLSQVYDSYHQMYTSPAFSYCHSNSPHMRSQSPHDTLSMSPFAPATNTTTSAASVCIVAPESLDANLDYAGQW